jgi:hypothetical protein
MGLSEMLASLSDPVEVKGERLPSGLHNLNSAAPQDVVQVDSATACNEHLSLQGLRMPVSATPDRVFSHRAYWVEVHGRPFPAKTAEAWQAGPDVVVFL